MRPIVGSRFARPWPGIGVRLTATADHSGFTLYRGFPEDLVVRPNLEYDTSLSELGILRVVEFARI